MTDAPITDPAIFGLLGTLAAATIALLGVVVGAALSWGKDWFFERQKRAAAASYLAVRAVCILDRFVANCSDIVFNDDEGDGQSQASLPKLGDFPDNVDWKSISSHLMYKLLAFPNEILSANNSITFVANMIAGPPDYEEADEERCYQYALLGLTAINLANTLRKKYAIPRRTFIDWNPEEEFRRVKQKMEASREASRKRNAFAFPPDGCEK